MTRKKTEEKKLNLCETSERRLYVERWGQMGKSRGNDIKVFHRTEAQRTAVTSSERLSLPLSDKNRCSSFQFSELNQKRQTTEPCGSEPL